MCGSCGCGGKEATIEGAGLHEAVPGEAHAHEEEHEHVHADGTRHRHSHAQSHAHSHAHAHAPAPERDHRETPEDLPVRIDEDAGRLVRIEQDILAHNDRYAGENRRRLAERAVFALNLVSSPGSGKTSLLVRTIRMLDGRLPVAVIEGDQQTSLDADRIRATGAPAVQVNTGRGCHLDARMVGIAIDRLAPPPESVLLIENVGNLVCPSSFDLGEACKVVVLSVTEGEDKPLKYPDMFRAARLLLLNKCDLLPHLEFDVEAAIGHARRVNPCIEVIRVSARTGEGMAEWLAWVERGAAASRTLHDETVEALRRRVSELERRLAAS